MDPIEIIERYATDVGANLPGWKRADVVKELSELLTESLHGRAEDSGRQPDEAMALTLCREFGRPAEVAARYHPPFAIIEPTDTRGFIIAAIIGALALAVAGPPDAVHNEIQILGWLGVLVLIFAAKGFIDRSTLEKRPWTPRRKRFAWLHSDKANRWGAAATLALTALSLAVYLSPGRLVGLIFPSLDVSGWAYTDDFRHWLRMPWLAEFLVGYIVLYAIVLVRGRWGRATRFFDIVILIHMAVQLGWHFKYGQIFVSPKVESGLQPFASALSLELYILAAVKIFFEWGRWTFRRRKPAA
ncbi:hypothetical protein BH11PSE2_BH11PSE2_12400 [soil metagenome]